MKKVETMLYSHHDLIKGIGEPRNNNSRYIKYRNKWEELPLKKKVSEFPLHLDIEITNLCNLRCPMCYRRAMRDKKGFMDFNLYKKVINEGEKYGLPSINLSWRGEPLLHPKFFDMVKYAKKHNIIDIRINTNGVLLDDYKIKKLVSGGVDKVIFSIDGVTKKTYESIRIGANFDKVVSNIRKLVSVRNSMGKEKPSVEIQTLDMKQTRKEIKKFINFWSPIVNRIIVVKYRNPFGKEKDKFRIEKLHKNRFPCPQLWQRLVIGWDGKIYKCCGDNLGLIILGDAKQDSLYKLWHGSALNNIRNLHKRYNFEKISSCKICEFNRCMKRRNRVYEKF